MRTQAFRIYPMRGIDQRWRADENAANRIEDMTWLQNDSWRECGGLRSIVSDSSFDGEGRVDSIHWFSQHNGARQWLMWETSGGALRAFNGTKASPHWDDLKDSTDDLWDGTTREREAFSTPWQKSQSQAFGNRFYIINGVNEPLVFNGRYTERAGFATAPQSPIATVLRQIDGDENWLIRGSDIGLGRLSAADGDTQTCAHRYMVSFLNERGQESPLSPASEMVTFDNGDGEPVQDSGTGGRSIVYVQIPKGGPETVARRVYRTRNILNSDGEPVSLGFGDDFYFLREFQDNVVTSFEDAIPDTNLGPLVDTIDYGPWPTGAKYIASFKNTMFIAGESDNIVRYSRAPFAEVFPEDNIFSLGDGALGPITGMYPTKNALVVFKERGIYLIKGDPSVGFFAETLNRDIGCIAPNSIRELPALGLVFMSHAGVYMLAGALENTGTPTGVVNLTNNVPQITERINRSAAINAFGAVYHTDKEYWLAVPSLGAVENDLLLVYHYEIGEWSTRTGFPVNSMVEVGDHRGYMMIGSHDDTNKAGVLVYSRGWPDKLNGEEISPLYETTDIDFGSVYGSIQPAHVFVNAIAHGNNDFQLNYRQNQAIDQVRVAAQSADQQDPNLRFPVYGAATWGTDRWHKLRPVVIRFDISTTHVNPTRELSLTFSAALRRIQIIGYDIEAKTGEQRLIKPLNEALAPAKG